jgi:ferredoxin-fold anticodon binding domain-containing protein
VPKGEMQTAIKEGSLDSDINAIATLIEALIKKNNISFSSLIELIRGKRKEDKIIIIPLSILKNRSLGILECVTKYLKENLNLRYHDIAILLKRDERPIWTTYNNAKKKYSEPFLIEKTTIFVPLTVFANRNLGLLENLTKYLKERLNLKYREIAKILNRDNRTIWACYNKAINKENESK